MTLDPLHYIADLFVFICVCAVFYLCCVLFHTAYMYYYCEHGGMGLIGSKPSPSGLSTFSTFTLLVESFDMLKPVLDMAYYVFGGMLNLLIYLLRQCNKLYTLLSKLQQGPNSNPFKYNITQQKRM